MKKQRDKNPLATVARGKEEKKKDSTFFQYLRKGGMGYVHTCKMGDEGGKLRY